MLFPRWIAAIAIFTTCASARASLTDYLAARKAYPPRNGVSLSAVRTAPGKYVNAVLELKGTVAGVFRSDDASNVMLRVSDTDSVLIQGSADAALPNSGESARALVSIQDNGRYSLISLVTETEIGAYQIDPPKPVAKAVTRAPARLPVGSGRSSLLPKHWPVPNRNRAALASRTGLTTADLALYTQVVQSFNRRLTWAQADVIARNIVETSYTKGVDARLIMAIFATESRFKLNARSRTGAMGLGQLMPGTARSLGVTNAWDPIQNIEGAVRLIQRHWINYAAKHSDFGTVFKLVCAAYNAGPGAVKKYGGVPPYRETQDYVRKVAYWYRQFAPTLFES